VLVGDSRNRILQQQLQEFLQLANGTEPEDLGAEDIPQDKFYSVELLSTREMCRKKDKHCSRSVGSELLHLDFWRRPYVYSLFVAKLKEMVLTCRRRPSHCPDLVVLNDAVWYCRRFWLSVKVGTAMFWMMKMREDMVDVASVLRELTELTTVIWRLDESITSDVTNLNLKADFQKRITASHSFVYDLRRRVPQLAVWSSMLSETVDFAHRVCGPLKHVSYSEDERVEDIFDQCDDEIHVGTWMRQRFVSMMLDTLCEVDGPRERGHCCRDYDHDGHTAAPRWGIRGD